MDNYLQIEPYVEMELDCLQNLYASLINYNGLEVKYLGAIWPWEFKLEPKVEAGANTGNDVRYSLTNTKCVSKKRLKMLYDADLTYYNPGNPDDMWNEIRTLLDRGVAVVVGIDQYYIHYHYPYIYKKQHGFHSVMLLGYNAFTDEIYCIDAIPKYKGTISKKEFIKGILSNGSLWYSKISFPNKTFQVEEEKLWNYFVNYVRDLKILLDRCEKRSNDTMNSNTVYTQYIISSLKRIIHNEDKKIITNEIGYMCRGVWGWEIDRKGNWLASYLQLPGVKRRFKYWEESVALIIENNKNWMLAYRFLFKGLQGAPIMEMTTKALYKLYEIKQREKKLLDLLTS